MHRQFLIGKLSAAVVVSNYVLCMIDGIQMSLWGIAWLTCLCGSMEDAWRQNCRLALEKLSGLLYSYESISCVGCREYAAAEQLDLDL